MSGVGEFGPAAVEQAAEVLRERIQGDPEVLVVLGSGLAGLSDLLEEPVTEEEPVEGEELAEGEEPSAEGEEASAAGEPSASE